MRTAESDSAPVAAAAGVLTPDDLDRLGERIDRLERQAGRWRLGAMALAAGLAFVLLTGQAPAGRMIEAGGIIVRDPSSGARVEIGAADGMPSMALHDATGHLRAALAIEENAPLFSLYSASGEPRLVLGQRGGAAFVIVRDAEGAPRAAMAVQENGDPSLYLLDADLDPLFRQPAVRDRD